MFDPNSRLLLHPSNLHRFAVDYIYLDLGKFFIVFYEPNVWIIELGKHGGLLPKRFFNIRLHTEGFLNCETIFDIVLWIHKRIKVMTIKYIWFVEDCSWFILWIQKIKKLCVSKKHMIVLPNNIVAIRLNSLENIFYNF